MVTVLSGLLRFGFDLIILILYNYFHEILKTRYTLCEKQTKIHSHQKIFVKTTYKKLISPKFCQKICESKQFVSSTVWKNEKFSLAKKIFRQINSLVTYLVKALLSRNFCQKCVRDNSRNVHTVCSTLEYFGTIFKQHFFFEIQLMFLVEH